MFFLLVSITHDKNKIKKIIGQWYCGRVLLVVSHDYKKYKYILFFWNQQKLLYMYIDVFYFQYEYLGSHRLQGILSNRQNYLLPNCRKIEKIAYQTEIQNFLIPGFRSNRQIFFYIFRFFYSQACITALARNFLA